MSKATSTSFVEHLMAACRLPVNMPVFLEGYESVLKGVADSGRFQVHGLTLDAPPGVYSPHETSSSRMVMDHFFGLGLSQPGGRLLEVGCGAGAISLLAAQIGWKVSAGDIDPNALEATRGNARLNSLQVDARVSDLCAAFENEKFDVIVFNQPFFHLDRETQKHERTLSDFGGQLYVRFMREVKKHLTPTGYILFTYSNCSNQDVFNQPGWALSLRAFDFDAGSNYIRAIVRGDPVI